jgi:hypothetical protein
LFFLQKPSESQRVALKRALREYSRWRMTAAKSAVRAQHYRKLSESGMFCENFLPTNTIPRYLIQYGRLSSAMVKVLTESAKVTTEQAAEDLARLATEAETQASKKQDTCRQLCEESGASLEDEEAKLEQVIQEQLRRLEAGLSKIRYHSFRNQEQPIENKVCRLRMDGQPRNQTQRSADEN